MNTQELIDQNIRMLLGDLQVQLVLARTRISELEAELSKFDVRGEPQVTVPEPAAAPNGVDNDEIKKPSRRPQ